MDRHLSVLEKRFHNFASRAENQWFFLEMTDVVIAVVLLLVLYLEENVAIGCFIRSKNCSDRPLEENEARWLMDDKDGAMAFIGHHQKIIHFIREKFSEQELLKARMFAQILLLHEDGHCFLVSTGCGHQPSEEELTGDIDFQIRLSLRMFLAIYDTEEFRRQLEKAIATRAWTWEAR